MRYFISYRHTGEDPARLEQLLPPLSEALRQNGNEICCTYFDREKFKANNYSPKLIMEYAFKKIEEMGNLLVILDSDQKSEGMLLEIGYCLAKGIPIILAKRQSVANTFLPTMVSKTINYRDLADLVAQLSSDEYMYLSCELAESHARRK